MKRSDIFLICTLVLIFLVFLGLYLFKDGRDKDLLVIQRENRIIYKESIYLDNEISIFDEKGNLLNIVHIENGEAWVSYASCFNKDCIKMGPIKVGSKKQIACLPNQVLIYLDSLVEDWDGVVK